MHETEKTHGKEIVLHPRDSMSAARVLYLEPLSRDSDQEDSASIVDYWHICRRRLPLIVALVVLGLIVGTLWAFLQTPVYRARVSLEIETPSDSTLSLRIADLESQGTTISPGSYLPTQIEVLKSRTLQQRALARLKQEDLQQERPQPGRLSSLRKLLGMAPGSHAQPAAVEVDVRGAENTRIVEIFSDSTRDSGRLPVFRSRLAGDADCLRQRYSRSSRTLSFSAVYS